MGRHRALLIGIENYENLTCVDYARSDVTALRARLVEFCSFLPDDIVVMTDESKGENRPTNDRIIASLDRFSNSCEPDDSFLFFFAGHGMHLDNESYLAAINANDHDPVTLKMTSVPLRWVKESIRRIPARQKVILTDACRNEPTKSRASGPNLMERGFHQSFRDLVVSRSSEDFQSAVGLMMACDQGERAYAWPEKGHGVFCQNLLDALCQHSADHEGRIVFSRVQESVQRGMEEWSRQRPNRRQTPCFEVRGHLTIGHLPKTINAKPVRRPALLIEEPPPMIVIQAEFGGDLFLNGEKHGSVPKGKQARISNLEPGRHTLTLAGDTSRFEWVGELIAGQVTSLVASVNQAVQIQHEADIAVPPASATSHGRAVVRMQHDVSPQNARPPLICFSSDGKLIATAGDDGAARVWVALTGREVASVRHRNVVTTLALSPNGKWVVSSGSGESEARVWSTDTGNDIALLPYESVSPVAISPNGRYLATAGQRIVRIWDPCTANEIAQIEHGGFVFDISFSPDSSLLAIAGQNVLQVSQVVTGKVVSKTPYEEDAIAIAFSPNGDWVASGGSNGTIGIWEVQTGAEIACMAHTPRVYDLAFSGDGRLLVSGGADWTARVWELPSGRELALMRHEDWVNGVAFSPDGNWVASTGTCMDKSVRVWEARSGREGLRLDDHGLNRGIAFSPHDARLAIATEDGAVTIWQAGKLGDELIWAPDR